MESKSLNKNKVNSLNKKKGLFLVIFSTLLIAVAQFFLKKGADITSDIFFSYLNIWIFVGVFLYGIATLLFIIGLKYGELSTLYPLLGLGYIWVLFISYFVLRETITTRALLGIILIIMGVAILGGHKDG